MPLQCSQCAMQNTDDSKFCKQCGAPVAAEQKLAPPPAPTLPPCHECQFVNVVSAQFCNQCGAPLNSTTGPLHVARNLRPATPSQPLPNSYPATPQNNSPQLAGLTRIAGVLMGIVLAGLLIWGIDSLFYPSRQTNAQKTTQNDYAAYKDTANNQSQSPEVRRIQQLSTINAISDAIKSLNGKQRPQPQVSESEYADFLSENVRSDGETMREFQRLCRARVEDVTIESNPAWRNQVNSVIDRWYSTGQKLIESTPPPRLIPAHRELLNAYLHFLKGGRLFEQYLADGNIRNVEESTTELRAGGNATERATSLLSF